MVYTIVLISSVQHTDSALFQIDGGGLVTKSCPTLEIPWTIAHQTRLSMGFSRQEYYSGLTFPSPGDLPNPGIKPRCPALQADFLSSEPQENPKLQIHATGYVNLKHKMVIERS